MNKYAGKPEQKVEFKRIMALSEEERESLFGSAGAIQEHLGISRQTYNLWNRQGSTVEFNIRDAFLKDQNKIWKAFMNAVVEGKINAQLFRTFAQLANELVEKREDNVRFELTSSDRIGIANQLRDSLRREYENSGSCPICFQPKILRHEICLGAESEQPEDREVAAVALPIRPD